MSRKAGPPQARPAKGGRIKEKRKLKAKHTSEAHCPLNKKRFRRGACNSPKRNTEKSSYTTAHDCCDQFVEERSSPRRRGPRAGAAQQLGRVRVRPARPSGEPGLRDPPPSPCSAYVCVRCTGTMVGEGGTPGGRALWALTFYNPNLSLPTRERRPVERPGFFFSAKN